MIMEATNEIGSNDLILQLNEADTQKFKDDLSSQGSDSFEIEGIKFTLGEPIDAIGGAILKTANGDIEVNNTIEARLERFKSILRSEVAEILFKNCYLNKCFGTYSGNISCFLYLSSAYRRCSSCNHYIQTNFGHLSLS